MSIENIIDYVNETPHNTNIGILRNKLELYDKEITKGNVKSVNGILPDEQGSVTIAYDDLENKPFGEEVIEKTVLSVFDFSDWQYNELWVTGADDIYNYFNPDDEPLPCTVVFNGIVNGVVVDYIADIPYAPYEGMTFTLLDEHRIRITNDGIEYRISCETISEISGMLTLTMKINSTIPLDSKFIGEDIARVEDIPMFVTLTDTTGEGEFICSHTYAEVKGALENGSHIIATVYTLLNDMKHCCIASTINIVPDDDEYIEIYFTPNTSGSVRKIVFTTEFCQMMFE